MQEGQYEQAVASFTEAIRCDPKDYRCGKRSGGSAPRERRAGCEAPFAPSCRRFFGNRSYCYYCLEQYPQALADAERAIQLAPDWPKGHFRQGSALMGMKVRGNLPRKQKAGRGEARSDPVSRVLQRYSEAERAMEQVLKLDTDCEEAAMDLLNCRVLQLMVSLTQAKGVSC